MKYSPKHAPKHAPSAFCLQPLESRMMLSASSMHPMHAPHAAKPHGKPHADNAVLVADRMQTAADVQVFVADQKAGQAMLKADRSAIEADRQAGRAALDPLRAKLEADRQAMNAALAADRAAGQPTRDADRPAIVADLAKLKADQGNADLMTADQAQLQVDVQKFAADMAPFEAQTKADIALWNVTIKADMDALAAAQVDSPQLTADKQKLSDDEAALKLTLSADRQKIEADMAKYHQDGGGDKSGGDKSGGGDAQGSEPKGKKV